MSQLVAAWLVVVGLQPSAADARWLVLVDDLEYPLQSSVEVCFRQGTETNCHEHRSRVKVPEDFLSVRVEGPDYGPASGRSEHLRIREDGNLLLVVPRKGLVQIDGVEAALTLSMYRQTDLDFRTPVARLAVPTSKTAKKTAGLAGIRVRAGEFLISLSSVGAAPDLHLVTVVPGGTHTLSYRRKPGWSLLLRTLSAQDLQPVNGTKVRLLPLKEFASGRVRQREAQSTTSGLAIFTGITEPVVSASLIHSEFVEEELVGLAGSPGTFGFREVELREGGTILALVHFDSKPRKDAGCEVLDSYKPGRGPDYKRHSFYQGQTDAQGFCESPRLAPGWYTFHAVHPSGQVAAARSVHIKDQEQVFETFDLQSIRLTGTIYRGAERFAKAVVYVSPRMTWQGDPNTGVSTFMLSATANEDGEYSHTLWQPGEYNLMLFSAAGTPGAHKKVHLAPGEENVDFHLDPEGLRGFVLDENGTPLEQANVLLDWNDNRKSIGRTDETGAFSFPVEKTGTAQLRAIKQGYAMSQPMEVVVSEGVSRKPLIVRLRREVLLSGTLSVGGQGVANAYLADAASQLVTAWTDDEGRFEIPTKNRNSMTLLVRGGGCPLTHFHVRVIINREGQVEPVALGCVSEPASLSVLLQNGEGEPIQNASLLLRQEGVVIPQTFLASHLRYLGLPAATDSSGRLNLVGLMPGHYDLFSASRTTEALVRSGSDLGYINSVQLHPLSTQDVKVTVDAISTANDARPE